VEPRGARFDERPTEPIVMDGIRFAAPVIALGGVGLIVGWYAAATVCAVLGAFVAFFFRNPERAIPGDERSVVSPADGRVIEGGEIEEVDGGKVLRIGIFLSIFNVHVNRAPLAGRVVSIDRSGSRFLAAFDRRAEDLNVRCTLTLETAAGVRFGVAQITGLIARRIVCHPQLGDWIERGQRYGLIRFGSRTDVTLPTSAEACVQRGDRVRGGSSVIARLVEAT
jgi:phosphatidylserine decarboxylase